MPKPALNPRQAKFVELYLAGLSATEAYVKAGYRCKREAAGTNAARLLGNDLIRAAVERANAKALGRAEVSREEVIGGLLHEARREDGRASHAARVSAWRSLAEVVGLIGPAAKAEAHVTVNASMIKDVPLASLTDEDLEAIDVLLAKYERPAANPMPDPTAVVGYLRDLGLPCPDQPPASGTKQS